MSSKTTNFEFIKPELSDVADITAMNENWDKIDEKLGKTVPSIAELCSESADNLTVPLAIIELNTVSNPDLYKILREPTAWIYTIFQDNVSTNNKRMQIAVSNHMKGNNCKIAYRIYTSTSWGDWNEVACNPTMTVFTETAGTTFRISQTTRNEEIRVLTPSGLLSLILEYNPYTPFDTDTTYHSTIIFKSGATATTLTNTAGIYFTGDDCDGGVLTPVANKVYELGIWWNGLSLQGVVRGV